MPGWFDRLLGRRPVAFVLSGGGNLGAVQVGMLQALAERGIVPDLVVGCSVGSLNGAVYAADPTVDGVRRLEALWRGLGTDDVMPSGRWLPSSVQLARKGISLHDNEALRNLVDAGLGGRRAFSDLALRFECVATRLDPPAEVWFSDGDLQEAVVASAALPAVFPPVRIGGSSYLDGAVANDVPLSRAVELGARRIYVLSVGNLARPWIQPRRPLDVAVHAYWLARRLRYERDLAALPPRVHAIVLPRGAPARPKYDDFSQTDELITQAYAAAAAHLDAEAGRRELEGPEMPFEAAVDGSEPPPG